MKTLRFSASVRLISWTNWKNFVIDSVLAKKLKESDKNDQKKKLAHSVLDQLK